MVNTWNNLGTLDYAMRNGGISKGLDVDDQRTDRPRTYTERTESLLMTARGVFPH